MEESVGLEDFVEDKAMLSLGLRQLGPLPARFSPIDRVDQRSGKVHCETVMRKRSNGRWAVVVTLIAIYSTRLRRVANFDFHIPLFGSRFAKPKKGWPKYSFNDAVYHFLIAGFRTSYGMVHV